MNGVESLLLIIIGFLSMASAFHIFKVHSDNYGKIDKSISNSDHHFGQLVGGYGFIAFIAGNIMFFIWLFKTFF